MDFATDKAEAISSTAGGPGRYRVEVSGWDAKEGFFVERTLLDWNEQEAKTVTLRATVRFDSVLFVRLLRPPGGGATFPVPYRIVKIEDSGSNARIAVGLQQLQPRMAFREAVAVLAGGGSKVV